MKVEAWKPEDCQRCVLKSAIKYDDGRETCLYTANSIKATHCALDGPLIREPKTPAELNLLIKAIEGRLREAGLNLIIVPNDIKAS